MIQRMESTTHRFGTATRAGVLVLALTAAPATVPAAPQDGSPPVDSARLESFRDALIPVRSIGPTDTDFTDLEPLRERLADVRVLVLGEPSHGDGAAFEARARLIRFLHQELGFNTLAFESGLFTVERALDGATTPAATLDGANAAIFPVWSQSEQAAPALRYAASTTGTSSPLRVVGMDAQLARGDTVLIAELVRYLRANGFPDTGRFDRAARTLHRLVARSVFDRVWPLERWRFRRGMVDARVWLAEGSDPERQRWLHFVDNGRAYVETAWRKDMASREAQMAANLDWLLERDPDARIVVWIASVYGITGADGIENLQGRRRYPGVVSMGERLRDRLGAHAVYTLAFTASGGEYGTWRWSVPVRTLPTPSPGSLEALFEATGLDYAILDLRRLPRDAAWLAEPMVARPLAYNEMRARWPSVVDGFFLIREMTPSTRLEHERRP
jgi:erythromycin esterase